MKIEDYRSLRDVEDVLALSADGDDEQWFAYVCRTHDDDVQRELRVGHTGDGETRLVTTGRSVSDLRVVPSAGLVSFLGLGDPEEDGRCVYTTDPFASAPDPTPVGVEGSVSNYAWSPDGDELAVVTQSPSGHQSPETVVDLPNAPSVRLDGGPECDAELCLVDRTTDTSRHVADVGQYQSVACRLGHEPAVGDDGRVAFVDVRTTDTDPGATDLYVAAPDGDVTRLTDGSLVVRGPTWSPDGRQLCFYGEDALDPYAPADVYCRSPTAGVERLTREFDRTVGGPPVWIDDETVAFLAADEARGVVYGVDVRSDSVTALTDGVSSDESVVAFDVDGTEVVTARTHATRTPTVEVTDTATGDTVPAVSTTSPSVEASTMEFRRVGWLADDGTQVEGLVYEPGDLDAPYPTVVSIHGGPVAFDYPEFIFDYAYWVNRGYAVFCPNYRGSRSYGAAFTAAIADGWGPVETADVLSGTAHLVENGVADATRLYVTGYSYGATLTARVLAESDRFVAGVAEQGVYDFRSAFGGTDAHESLERHLGKPWERPTRYDTASVVTDVEQINDPLLLFAAGEDSRTPPSQSRQLFVALRRSGTPARLVEFDSASHGFASMGVDRLTARLTEMSDWFEQIGGGDS